MSSLPAGTIPIEYDRGQGFNFPTDSTVAISTSSASASSSSTSVAGVGVSLPASGTEGQLFFVTGSAHLYVYTTTWVQVV